VDNLRWIMIVLVILVHAAVTFSHIGSWYYYGHGEPGPVSWLFFLFLETHLQAFFMGLLFLIAGYFAPGSCDRKGVGRFLGDRAVRLGLPTLLYVAVIQPAIVYYLLSPERGESIPSLTSIFHLYFASFDFLHGTGPMWFALALLVFTVIYALVRLAANPPAGSQTDAAPPGHIAVAALIAIIAAGAFLVRLVMPIGTSVLNMQLCFFTQYIVLFIVGICAYRRNWLVRLPRALGVRWLQLALVIGPVLWIGIVVVPNLGHRDITTYVGGWHWQSFAYTFWESFFCVGFSLGLLVVFRDRWNRQGPFARFMSNNAFAVYVFHPPILIAITLYLSRLALTPVENFLLAAAFAVPICFLAGEFVFRRVPGLKQIL
jgi:hypothetical protein